MKYLIIAFAPFEIRTIPCFSDFRSLYMCKKALVIWMCQIWQKINRSLYWIPLELGGSVVASNCKFQNSGCYCAAHADTQLQCFSLRADTFQLSKIIKYGQNNCQKWRKSWFKLRYSPLLMLHNMDVLTTLKMINGGCKQLNLKF